MNLLRRVAQIYVPAWVQKRKLRELFACTASAFECGVPPLEDLSPGELLWRYALFSEAVATGAIERGLDLRAIQARLYQNAYQMGQGLRRTLRITTSDEAMAVARVLYRALGMDFRGTSRGEVVVSRCFFSSCYSSRVCQVISALDDGLLAGLSGGGRLTFHERMTEGAACCKARFLAPEALRIGIVAPENLSSREVSA